jgi:hypothetical protein
MTRDEVKDIQRSLNRFTKKYLKGVAPLTVDGDKGALTNRRIKWVKFYLGYGKTANANDTKVTSKFVRSLRHPHSRKYNTARVLAAAFARRTRQRARARQQSARATISPGVTTFDGVPCARWIVPWLKKSRANGWKGRLVSGWRSPAYSESLCRRMCGAPRCPGRCAGRSSNHSGNKYPAGAVDVSDYANFERIQPRIGSPLINRLDARDPTHFSVSGR